MELIYLLKPTKRALPNKRIQSKHTNTIPANYNEITDKFNQLMSKIMSAEAL